MGSSVGFWIWREPGGDATKAEQGSAIIPKSASESTVKTVGARGGIHIRELPRRDIAGLVVEYRPGCSSSTGVCRGFRCLANKTGRCAPRCLH